MSERTYAYAVSAVLLGLTLWPLTRDVNEDGFPLSTYPMFARQRDRIGEVRSAIARDAAGAERLVPPRYVANSEAMQVVATLRRTIAAGPKASRELCKAIARRIADDRPGELAVSREVLLVTQKVDAIDFLAGRQEPLERRVHARCGIPKIEER
jgi:hypothetical protein